MSSISNQLRCSTHPQREVAARCTGCNGFFCRECITEHDLRMLCASCLRKTIQRPETARRKSRIRPLLGSLFQLACGLIILWLGFYLLGRLLIAIPSDMHEGTLWKDSISSPP